MKNKETVLFIFILCIVCGVIGYFVNDKYRPKYKPDTSISDQLKKENDALELEIKIQKSRAEEFERQLDSIESIKPKISIKYVIIYKKIDSLPASGIVDEFSNVFTNAGIK